MHTRTLSLIPLALLASACWKPGPGQVDPTRYPWDRPQNQPKLEVVPMTEPTLEPTRAPEAEVEAPPERAPELTACVHMLTPSAESGIEVVGGGTVDNCPSPSDPAAAAVQAAPPVASSGDYVIEASPPVPRQ